MIFRGDGGIAGRALQRAQVGTRKRLAGQRPTLARHLRLGLFAEGHGQTGSRGWEINWAASGCIAW